MVLHVGQDRGDRERLHGDERDRSVGPRQLTRQQLLS
jgi:hypothetical protein